MNGAFAMDSAETHCERELGASRGGAPRVLVGGLGLGHTVGAVLEEADRRRSGCGSTWSSSRSAWSAGRGRGARPRWPGVAADPRVRLHVGDVATSSRAPAEPAGPWDAILLDVDNGPDFLIHAQNDALYGEPALRAAYGAARPGRGAGDLVPGPVAGPARGPAARRRLRGGDAAHGASARAAVHVRDATVRRSTGLSSGTARSGGAG